MNATCLITIVLCTIVMFVALLGTVTRIRRNGFSDLADWLVFSLGAYNGIGIVFIIFEVQGEQYARVFKEIISNGSIVWMYPLYTLITIFGIWIGAALFSKPRNNIELSDLGNEFNNRYHAKTILRLAITLQILAVVLYWLYVLPYGGFTGYFKYALAIRAALFDEVDVDRSWSFLKRFGGLSFFASFLIAGLILMYRKHRWPRVHLWLIFLFSFGFSLYVLYSWGGRLGMMFFLTSFIVGFFLYKNGYSFPFLVKMTIPVLIIFSVLPFTSKIWGHNKGGDELSTFFVNEISFPLFVFNEAYHANKPRWMQDVILAPAYILPSRIWGGMLEMDTVTQISTERVVGVRKGVNRSTKGVPVDFISFGIMEGGVLGVFLVGLIFGFLFKKIDRYLFWQFWPGPREVLYGYAIFSLSVELVLYSDPKSLIINNFHFIFGLILIKFFNRNRKLKQNTIKHI